MAHRWNLVLLVAALAVLTVAVPAFALMAAPTLVLFGLLLVRRFPGEELIERWRERRRSAQRLVAPRTIGAPRGVARVSRVGRLLAFALAVRPPPAALRFA